MRIDLPRTAVDYPFSIPVIRAWEPLEFSRPVTFFVGENGSGKSTLLEALAAAAGSVTAGAAPANRDPELKSVRRLADRMRLIWNKRTQKGFFLCAEDFIGWIRGQVQTRAELEADLARVDDEYEVRSDYAKDLAKMASAGQLRAMQDRYGDGLETRSHGQQFLDFFRARFVPGGLYLLDEPEAPLSPMRQLAFLSLVKQMLAEDAQFIIATHSPILMAFPGAEILSFDHAPPKRMAFDDLEHVQITRDFLNNPQAYLRHL
ncbi:MAG TPA: AAA family ATPase [Anaerolineales bacterium]|nr:AAA family ATPase [Anaerolineales bacterium]